jgi:hypothetical protein
MEHRCGYRRETQLKVIIRGLHGHAAEGLVSNISASGALIVTSLPVRLSSQVFVQFEYLQPFSRTRRAIAAEVIRCETGAFAIEWEDFSPQAVRAVLRQLGANREYESRDRTVEAGPGHRRVG